MSYFHYECTSNNLLTYEITIRYLQKRKLVQCLKVFKKQPMSYGRKGEVV